MSAPTIAILSPGVMGAAVGARLVRSGCTVLTTLTGRSPATHKRAADAGMRDASLGDIVCNASWILSILPPRDAIKTAEGIRDAVGKTKPTDKLVFVDCNAVSPETTKRIAALLNGTSVRFVDAGIIGGPPKEGYDPAFYASANDVAALDEFDELGKRWGLRVIPLSGEGVGVGDASALKMSYAGITKGTIGLYATMVLAAHASSPATAAALMNELGMSQLPQLTRLTNSVPGMVPKAYRWIAEMEEIGAFVGPPGTEGDIYRGLARLYERIEHAVDEKEKGETEGDVQVLDDFVQRAKKLLEEKNKAN